MDASLSLLEGAGLVEQHNNDEGKEAMSLTPDGARVARQMAMSKDPEAVLNALLEGGPSGP